MKNLDEAEDHLERPGKGLGMGVESCQIVTCNRTHVKKAMGSNVTLCSTRRPLDLAVMDDLTPGMSMSIS